MADWRRFFFIFATTSAKSLAEAQLNGEDGCIGRATCGIAFDTPHRGGAYARLSGVAANNMLLPIGQCLHFS